MINNTILIMLMVTLFLIALSILLRDILNWLDQKEFNKIMREMAEEVESNFPKIKIKYFDEDITKLELIGGKSDWIDLRAAENIGISKGEFKLIPLGIAMELPEGYEAHIVPRSSTFKNFKIIQTNSMGRYTL